MLQDRSKFLYKAVIHFHRYIILPEGICVIVYIMMYLPEKLLQWRKLAWPYDSWSDSDCSPISHCWACHTVNWHSQNMTHNIVFQYIFWVWYECWVFYVHNIFLSFHKLITVIDLEVRTSFHDGTDCNLATSVPSKVLTVKRFPSSTV